jgi:hypothetical protein
VRGGFFDCPSLQFPESLNICRNLNNRFEFRIFTIIEIFSDFAVNRLTYAN